MKINEVEKILNIPKATIRFYEKEGLLNPQRNENSYREYSEEDLEQLKKILVLRKIGVTVEDINQMFKDQLSLKDALEKNIHSLNEQMKELEGALKLCTTMQEKESNLASLDEDYYLNLIQKEEAKGNKFYDIMNDVINFEKQVIGNEFGLLDEEGKMKYSPAKSIILALAMCLMCGLLWFFLDGMNVDALKEGFIFPLVCILISSVLGLPVYFIGKKNPKLAKNIKRLGMGIGVLFLAAIIILMIVTA